VGGEVCVCNSQRLLLAAAETENDRRGAAQQLRRGACFVFMLCLMCGVCQPANRTSNIYLDHQLALHDDTNYNVGGIGSTTSSFRDTRKVQYNDIFIFLISLAEERRQLMVRVRINCFLAWRERIESTHKTHHVGT
jgi:hypothetical protein